jgi:hypothetical protein
VWHVVKHFGYIQGVDVRFDPPRCDHCDKESILQIITVAFEGSSPPDQFLCRTHAPSSRGTAPEPSTGKTAVDATPERGRSETD